MQAPEAPPDQRLPLVQQELEVLFLVLTCSAAIQEHLPEILVPWCSG